jgi:para-nitrobenzyl esterase
MTEASAKALLGDAFPDLLSGYIAMTGKPPATAAISLAEDAGFALPSFALADKHAEIEPRTFVYYFDQVPVDLRATAAGTDHGGELEYVFGTKPVEHRWDASDAAVSKMMGDYWVRFAKTGDPNGGPNTGGAPRWPAVTNGPTAYLAVGGTTRAERLAPIRERAKTIAMAVSVQKWAKTEQP